MTDQQSGLAMTPIRAPGQPAWQQDPPAILGLRLLWANRALLGKSALIVMAITLGIAFLIPNQYTAIARVMPPEERSGASAFTKLAAATAGGGNAGLALEMLGGKGNSAVFASVLQTRTVQDRLVRRFQLQSVYGEKLMTDTRVELAERTQVAEERKTGIITIYVTDRDPKRAAEMARAYVEELNAAMAEVNTTAAHKERVFLEERLKSVRAELDEAAKGLSEYGSKTGAVDITAQGKAMVEAAARLQGELIIAESEMRGLQQIYTANNARVRMAAARVNALKTQLDRISGVIPSGADAPYPSIRELPRLGVLYMQFYRQLKINEAVFEVLTKQYEIAKVEEAKELPLARLLDNPEIPERKSGPARALMTAGAGFATLLAMSAWLLLAGVWAQRDPQEPAVRFLGEIFDGIRQARLRKSAVKWLARSPKGERNGDGNGAV